MGYLSFGYTDLTLVSPPSGNAPDLLAAIIAHLRATPAVVAAFGEDTSAEVSTKFFADGAWHEAQLPWLVYEETGSDYMYMTGDNAPSIETGQLLFKCVSKYKKEARDLGRLVASTLNEAPLVFDDGLLMNLRAKTPFFTPASNIFPGSPTGFVCGLVFDFMVERPA